MNKWGVGLTLLLASASVLAKDIQLLNVSYDPTRELYEQYNKAFSAHWKQETGDNVVICGGMTPLTAEAFDYSGLTTEFYAIGDCNGAGNLEVCNREAYSRAMIL